MSGTTCRTFKPESVINQTNGERKLKHRCKGACALLHKAQCLACHPLESPPQNRHSTPKGVTYQLLTLDLKASKFGTRQNQAWAQQGQPGVAYRTHSQ